MLVLNGSTESYASPYPTENQQLAGAWRSPAATKGRPFDPGCAKIPILTECCLRGGGGGPTLSTSVARCALDVG